MIRKALLSVLLPFLTLFGQVLPSIPSSVELDHFRHILMRIGSIDVESAELQHRRDLFVTQFQLSPADATLLGAIADEFHASLLQSKTAAAPILAKNSQTDADRAALSKLIDQRDQTVVRLIAKLKLGLRPDSANRIWQPLAAFVASNGGQHSSEDRALEAAWASGPRLANTTVPLRRGFDTKAPFESPSTDASGIARISTKYWERIEIHLPRIIEVDHLACLMVNSRCAPLPIGTTFDKKNSILYWHVPNAYKGDFDFVFLQPGSRVLVFRVTAGTGSPSPGEGFPASR